MSRDYADVRGGDEALVSAADVVAQNQPHARSFGRRLLLGWSDSSLPVAALLLLGVLLGPQGASVLSAGALSALDPAIPVALAALGVLVGLGFDARRAADRASLAAAAVESTGTVLLVAAGLAAVTSGLVHEPAGSSWILPFVCGIGAASSLMIPVAFTIESSGGFRRYAERGIIVPILAGAFLLAWARQGSGGAAGLLVAQLCAVASVLALAGWLLLRRTSGDTERRVFGFAALLLVGGAADYLSASALLGGLTAGLFWQGLGGVPLDNLRRGIPQVQHPLVALVLLVAGARAELTAVSAALAGVYVCLRVAARLAGATAVRRMVGDLPRDFRLRLVSPGVFGVAFALNALRAVGSDAALSLSVVVFGTMLSEVVLQLVLREELEA